MHAAPPPFAHLGASDGAVAHAPLAWEQEPQTPPARLPTLLELLVATLLLAVLFFGLMPLGLELATYLAVGVAGFLIARGPIRRRLAATRIGRTADA